LAALKSAHACRRNDAGSASTRDSRSKIIVARSVVVYLGQSSPGTPVWLKERQRRPTVSSCSSVVLPACLPALRQRADSATRHPAIAIATGAVPETIL